MGGPVDTQQHGRAGDRAAVEAVDHGLPGGLPGHPLLAPEVERQLRLAGEIHCLQRAGDQARALRRDEATEAKWRDRFERLLDAGTSVDCHRHDGEILRQRQLPVGMQMLLGAVARDPSQQDARLELVPLVYVRQRVRDEAVRGTVALAEVDRQLERVVRHRSVPRWRPAQTATSPSVRLTAKLRTASASSPSSPSRWLSNIQVLKVV